MALIIERGSGANLEYHLPFTIKKIQEIQNYAGRVVSVTADGEELNHIINTIHGIPYTHHICTWRLPWSWFILENMTWSQAL
jgi:hypothetical protein